MKRLIALVIAAAFIAGVSSAYAVTKTASTCAKSPMKAGKMVCKDPKAVCPTCKAPKAQCKCKMAGKMQKGTADKKMMQKCPMKGTAATTTATPKKPVAPPKK